MMKWLKCEKESEDDRCVIYRYTDLTKEKEMKGSFRIAKTEFCNVSTVQLPAYCQDRVDEMKLAGKLIIEYKETGEWPASAMVH